MGGEVKNPGRVSYILSIVLGVRPILINILDLGYQIQGYTYCGIGMAVQPCSCARRVE